MPDTDRTGYRNPPKKHRFKKGRSGNPRGRNRGDQNVIAVFKRMVEKRVRVRDGDRSITLTVAEAVILQNYRAAARGNSAAMKSVMKLAARAGELTDMTDPQQFGAPIAVPKRAKSIEEFARCFGRTLTDEERAMLKESGDL